MSSLLTLFPSLAPIFLVQFSSFPLARKRCRHWRSLAKKKHALPKVQASSSKLTSMKPQEDFFLKKIVCLFNAEPEI